jgi:pyrimidine operon attenuation protein / uracil phosphoribosyltransferase
METSQPPSSEEIAAAIQRLAIELADKHSKTTNLAIVGIARGGIELGKRLTKLISEELDQEIPYGVVDISFHRDDISSNPVPNIQSFANLPFDVEGRHIILVDDVIFSGRSIRAAINELFDQGRPSKVTLAVLIDRGGRSLPIQPDFTGIDLKVTADQRVEVIISKNSDIPDSISIATD